MKPKPSGTSPAIPAKKPQNAGGGAKSAATELANRQLILSDKIIGLSLSPPPRGHTHWNGRLLHKTALERGLVSDITLTTVYEILRRYEVSLRRVLCTVELRPEDRATLEAVVKGPVVRFPSPGRYNAWQVRRAKVLLMLGEKAYTKREIADACHIATPAQIGAVREEYRDGGLDLALRDRDHAKRTVWGVDLKPGETEKLEAIIAGPVARLSRLGKFTRWQIQRAKVLLMLGEKVYSAPAIGEILHCSAMPVYSVYETYQAGGLVEALKPKEVPQRRAIRDEQLERIKALRREAPPDGHTLWTVRRLGREAVKRGIIESCEPALLSALLTKGRDVLRGDGALTGKEAPSRGFLMNYRVTLRKGDRRKLLAMAAEKPKHPEREEFAAERTDRRRRILRARILLFLADGLTTPEVIDACAGPGLRATVQKRTVDHVRKWYVEKGLEAVKGRPARVLQSAERPIPPDDKRPKSWDGVRQEEFDAWTAEHPGAVAAIIALSRSDPPPSYPCWTYLKLADEAVSRGIAAHCPLGYVSLILKTAARGSAPRKSAKQEALRERRLARSPPVILRPGERELLEGVINAPEGRRQVHQVQRARILLKLAEMGEEARRGEKTLTITKVAGLCHTTRSHVWLIRTAYFKDGLERTLAATNPVPRRATQG